MWNRLTDEDYPVGKLLNAAGLNKIFFENMNFVYERESATFVTVPSLDPDVTASHQTYLDYIDSASYVPLTMTVEADYGIVMALLTFTLEAAATQRVAIDIDIDGDKVGRHMDLVRVPSVMTFSASENEDIALLIPLIGITPGAHTFRPVWAMESGGGATIDNTWPLHFGIWEVS